MALLGTDWSEENDSYFKIYLKAAFLNIIYLWNPQIWIFQESHKKYTNFQSSNNSL